jgi:hypothetical protein
MGRLGVLLNSIPPPVAVKGRGFVIIGGMSEA